MKDYRRIIEAIIDRYNFWKSKSLMTIIYL